MNLRGTGGVGLVNTRMTASPRRQASGIPPAPILDNTLAAVLGTRSCNSKSAALSNGQAMKRRCMGSSRRRLTSASRLIP
jgi:hypothetical protein